MIAEWDNELPNCMRDVLPMAFVEDPKNGRRVFDPESGVALTNVSRDAPKGEAWFDFLFEGTTLLAKAKVSWSDQGNRCAYVLQVKQLEDSFNYSTLRKLPFHALSPEEFRQSL